jgi:hypothetical protein
MNPYQLRCSALCILEESSERRLRLGQLLLEDGMSTSFAFRPPTLSGGEWVAWIRQMLGVILILGGAHSGSESAGKGPRRSARQRASSTVLTNASTTPASGESFAAGGREVAGDLEGAGRELREAAADADTSAGAAKSALDQMSGIVGALPENLRFAGMLALVGTVLVSVATVQFGGTFLF